MNKCFFFFLGLGCMYRSTSVGLEGKKYCSFLGTRESLGG